MEDTAASKWLGKSSKWSKQKGQFLTDSSRKKLFKCLSNEAVKHHFYLDINNSYITSKWNEIKELSDHREAGKEIIVHLINASQTYDSIRGWTGDIDVTTMIMGQFHRLLSQNPAADLWIVFGSGRNSSAWTLLLSNWVWRYAPA